MQYNISREGVIDINAAVIGKCPIPNKTADIIIASHTPMLVGLSSIVFLIL